MSDDAGSGLSSFLRHTLQTGAVRVLVVAIGFGTTVINARWLGVEGVGVYALLVLLKDFSFRYGHLGFGSAFAYFVARGEVSVRRCVLTAIPVALVTAAVTVMTILATWTLDFSPWRDIPAYLIYLSLPSTLLTLLVNHFRRILSGALEIEKVNISMVLATLGQAMFLVVFVVVMELGVAGAVLALLASDLVGCAYLALQFRRSRDRTLSADEVAARPLPLSTYWRYGRWNYLLMLLGFFTENLPLMLLKTLTMENAGVGLFSRARALAIQMRIVVQPFAQVLFPYTAASEEGRATGRTSALCRNSLTFLLPIVVVVALLIEQIIRLLYGEEFVPAARIFHALTPGILAWPIDYFLGVHLAASGRPREVLVASSISVIGSAALSYFLIPRYGAVGAGMSVSAIFVIETLARTFVYTRQTGARWADVFVSNRSDLALLRRLVEMLKRRLSG